MKPSEKDPGRLREIVSQAYTDAVKAPSTGSSSKPVQKGVAAKLAGYSSQERETLPAEAVVNSFGCGNPLAFSDVVGGDIVLDLGCGAGIDLLIAAKKVGAAGRVIGVDMTEEMVAKAREIVSESGLDNIEIRKGLIEDLPIESDSVDWVISNCVINLSPEKERVFSEIARVLKPGGRMLVSDIVADDLPEQVMNDPGLYCSCVAGAISEEAYLSGLRRAGLVDAEVRERIEYDTAHIEGVIRSDLRAPTKTASCCCSGDAESAERAGRLAEECRGKIRSAKIFARKPV